MSTQSAYTRDTVPQNPTLAGAGVTFARVLRSEWRKLWSLRATTILVLSGAGIMLLASGGLTAIVAATAGEAGFGTDAEAPWRMIAQFAGIGLQIGGLLVAANAVVQLAGEYTTHTAVSTYSAVPRRGLVYFAKVALHTVLGFVFGIVMYALSAGLVAIVLKAQGMDPELTGDLLVEALISGLYVAVLVCLALGLGAIMRNTTGAVVSVAVLVYVVSNVLMGFSFSGNKVVGWFSNHLPTAAVDALRPANRLSEADAADMAAAGFSAVDKLATWDVWLTVGFWAVVPIVLGYVMTLRRAVR